MTRDQLKKQKLDMRDLKSLTEELELLSNQFKGGMPKSVRDRLRRLEDVIKVKTAIYERAMKND